MAKGKFTFRKEPAATGLSAIGHPYPGTSIKFAGEVVGRISPPWYGSKDRKWGIGLMVRERASENCPWGWVFFKARFDTEPEARAFLIEHSDAILSKYTLWLEGTKAAQENTGENNPATPQDSEGVQ